MLSGWVLIGGTPLWLAVSFLWVRGHHTRVRMSCSWASVLCSSSVGLGDGLAPEENCEKVWKRVSVCASSDRACCRSWAQPVPVEADMSSCGMKNGVCGALIVVLDLCSLHAV